MQYNTFDNLTSIPIIITSNISTTSIDATDVDTSNLFALNIYATEIEAPTINTSFITTSNLLSTSNVSCQFLSSDVYINTPTLNTSNIIASNIASPLIYGSNAHYSNLELGQFILNSSRQMRGCPTVNHGVDTLVNTGLDFYARSLNYHIGVCRSSNITLSNNPAGLNSCAGINNLRAYAMRFRVLANSGSNGFIFQTSTETPLFTVNDQGLAYFNSNVGLGKANAGYQLDLSTDDARKLTNTTWTTGSDQRIKTDIVNADLDICYSNIKGINLKRFKWDSNIIGQVEDETMLGFIAQEVKTVFPKSVKIISDYGFDDFHNLNQDQLNKSLFGAVKKLIEKVEYLENIVLNK